MAKATFYTDSHIPHAAVKQLRGKGVDIVRCQDVGLDHANDSEHLTYASEHGHVMVSCDNDFPVLHWKWLAAEKPHSGIIYCREPDLCKISVIMENILLVHEDQDGKEELQNFLWRV
jgi:predicted nuclease of predicted toxin-antitoxin system